MNELPERKITHDLIFLFSLTIEPKYQEHLHSFVLYTNVQTHADPNTHQKIESQKSSGK